MIVRATGTLFHDKLKLAKNEVLSEDQLKAIGDKLPDLVSKGLLVVEQQQQPKVEVKAEVKEEPKKKKGK